MSSEYWNSKVAVVTGASVGIGAHIAIKLANAGITVVGLARRSDLIENLNKDVLESGAKIHAYHCDFTQEQSIDEAFKWIAEKFGSISILICNAGIIKANFVIESSNAEIKELYDLNVFATTICLREGLKLMRTPENHRGHIIVLNSILGHRIPDVAVPLFSVYPATKHAITGLCQTVRQEIHFLKLNIKLTSINPGMVDTDFLSVYSHTLDDLPKLNAMDVANAVMYALETPNHVQVEDVTLQAMRLHNAGSNHN
ncbi:farnesol dehydrogenase [Stomoxys calcitrans]|uniref:farnesol dehydrogenase n=1 Tax=Stomoxys calcitrans TaxID=35570 RepID=UPI0027E37300|nr:farnesol dehydrogenase [Stomoxys calcitrans]